MYPAPVVPNFRAAMKITLGASGSPERAPGSSRLHEMVSMPHDSSISGRLGWEKRATAIIRFDPEARLARRARLGPIFPPAPRINRSPSSAAMAAVSASLGRDNSSSSSDSDIPLAFYAVKGGVEITHAAVHSTGRSGTHAAPDRSPLRPPPPRATRPRRQRP